MPMSSIPATHSLCPPTTTRNFILPMAFVCLALLICQASATTLCANPGGTGGCYAKIQDAVNAASPADTVKVAPGIYKENVIISKSLYLVGDNRNNTVIDATGLPNGVYVNGLDNTGLVNVSVSGFSIVHSNFEGVLITNASFVTVFNNRVMENDKSLDIETLTCPGIPSFETAEGFDCGEGIHLLGSDHNTISNNIVERNAGGILISDDTGPVHDNYVSNNTVNNNPDDCGITLASHPAFNAQTPYGVYHNTISGNEVALNGLATGEGAGVGIFDSVPGAANYGNIVVNNRLHDNGLPGVALHSHTPGQNLNDNVIIGNLIMNNGADTDDAATPGKTGINVFGVSPVTGTVIAQNTIRNEHDAIVANTPAPVNPHLNNLFGDFGVENIGSGTVDATNNYWGCTGGPGKTGCSKTSGNVLFVPFLSQPF
jgi:parallel beta-helix repeat protein